MADADDGLMPTQSIVEQNKENGWLDLDSEARAIALQYVATGYSMRRVAYECGLSEDKVRGVLSRNLVKAYIGELQKDDYTSSVVTHSFIQSSLLSMIPKLAGEEEIPTLTSDGTQVWGRKFHAAEMRSVLEALGKGIGYSRETSRMEHTSPDGSMTPQVQVYVPDNGRDS